MSGLLTPILSVVQKTQPKVESLDTRLTAARAAALDDLDHSVLDAAGPLGAPPTQATFGPPAPVSGAMATTTLLRSAAPNTAGVMIALIDITGAGVLQFAGMFAGASSAIRMRIVVDGDEIADSTSVVPLAGQLLTLAGIGSADGIALDAIPFRSSLLIETANVSAMHTFYYHYRLTGAPA